MPQCGGHQEGRVRDNRGQGRELPRLLQDGAALQTQGWDMWCKRPPRWALRVMWRDTGGGTRE
jgi:hypothetical protein